MMFRKSTSFFDKLFTAAYFRNDCISCPIISVRTLIVTITWNKSNICRNFTIFIQKHTHTHYYWSEYTPIRTNQKVFRKKLSFNFPLILLLCTFDSRYSFKFSDAAFGFVICLVWCHYMYFLYSLMISVLACFRATIYHACVEAIQMNMKLWVSVCVCARKREREK